MTGSAEFWLTSLSGGAVHVRLEPPFGEIEVFGSAPSVPRLVDAALGEALAAGGLVHLHAAAVHRDHRRVAIIGTSGAGKSTALLAAMANGWAPVAEDRLWVDPHDLVAVGSDPTIRLVADDEGRLRSVLGDVAVIPSRGGKIEAAFPAVATAAPLTDVALLDRDGARGWHPLSETKAAMALYQATGVPHTARHREALADHIGGLVSRLRFHRLSIRAGEFPDPP